jgi:hypothetical protein
VAGVRDGVLSTPKGGGVEDRFDATPGLGKVEGVPGLSRQSGGASGHGSPLLLGLS